MNSTTDSLPTYEQVVYEDSKMQLEEDDDEFDCKYSFFTFLGMVLFCFFIFCFVFFIVPK
jgi:hypothetical protein